MGRTPEQKAQQAEYMREYHARRAAEGFYRTDEYRAKNKEKARATSARRYARKRGGKIVDRNVTWRAMVARDGILCAICDFPCDPCDYEMINDGKTFIAGPLYPTLDHVVAIANGGEHSMANGQLAHKHCNRMKSDR
jgi:5-methylcytosine-specific restriction endonuclease McrA